MLVQVKAPHFCAAIVLTGDVVIEAAPILGWTIGTRRQHLSAYFARRGWKAIIIIPGS